VYSSLLSHRLVLILIMVRESNISLDAQGHGMKPPSEGTFLSYMHTADHRYDHNHRVWARIQGWNGETCEPWWPHIHPRRVLVERASVFQDSGSGT
jgi:hypothetical protein